MAERRPPGFNVDLGFYDSDEVLSIPRKIRAEAVGVWTLAGAYAANQLTDGKVSNEKLRQLGCRPAIRGALMSTKPEPLWVEGADGDGVQFTRWAKWQRTSAEIRAFREADAERKRIARRSKSDPKVIQSSAKSDPNRSKNSADFAQNTITISDTQHCATSGNGVMSAQCPPGQQPDVRAESRDPKTETETETKEQEICATPLREPVPPQFPEFWDAYPRRRDRRKAEKAFTNALKRADPETIIAGAHRYATDPNREDQFTKYAEGWLNGDGWLDEPLPRRNGSHGPPVATSDLRVAQVQALKSVPSQRLEIE